MRRTSGTRPEGQRSVSYATIVEVVRAIGPAAAPVVPSPFPGAAASLEPRRRACDATLRIARGSWWRLAAPPPRPTGSTSPGLLPLLSAEETDRGVRDNAAGAAVRVLAADGFAAAEEFATTGPALLAATLAALPIAEDFEEAAATYGGLVSVFADQGAARVLARWAPATVALFARVVGDEYAKAREGWPGKDGRRRLSTPGPSRGWRRRSTRCARRTRTRRRRRRG